MVLEKINFFFKMSKNGEIIKWNNNPVYEIKQKKERISNGF